jgi:hypothetical protein
MLGSSVHVLSKDKELLVFPIISGIAAAIVMAVFAGGMYGAGVFDTAFAAVEGGGDEQLSTQQQILYGIVAFAFYFVNYFVVIYFNAALIGAAHIRLTGGDPTVADGFAAANRCLPAITGWAAIAATVGLILNIIESRSEGVARFVTGLIGMAWTLITFLVVPVIVIERASSFTAIKRSTTLLKDTWGEQIVSNIGFGLIGFLFTIPAVIIAGFGVFLAMGGSLFLGGSLIALGILGVLLVSIVMAALKGIFTAALYAHAAHEPIDYFSAAQLEGAFYRR